MTPAVVAAERAGIRFALREYEHDSAADSYGEEAAEKLGVDPASIFKTLVIVDHASSLAVAIVPVMLRLDLKAAARALGVKKTQMTDPETVQRATGYVVGGVSPLGQKQRQRTIIDTSAKRWDMVHVSGGKRGLEIGLSPVDLAALTNARFAAIARL